jgi:hypothetical protein
MRNPVDAAPRCARDNQLEVQGHGTGMKTIFGRFRTKALIMVEVQERLTNAQGQAHRRSQVAITIRRCNAAMGLSGVPEE